MRSDATQFLVVSTHIIIGLPYWLVLALNSGFQTNFQELGEICH